MNILLLSDDMLIGGVVRQIVDIANAMHARGHAVTVAATNGVGRTELNDGITFIPLYLKNNATFRNNAVGFIPSLMKLFFNVRSNPLELIHSHKRYSHLIGAILSRILGVPHITSYHNLFTDKRLLSVYGDETICCSNAIKEIVTMWNPTRQHKVVTIHNGIWGFREYSRDEKLNIRKKNGIPEQNIVISSVGQFIPVKDRETLLHAIKIVKDRFHGNNVTFLLIGYGPQKNNIIELSQRLRIDDITIISERITSIEACNISDFMVLNSITEGFPLILLEAASLSIPHIASRIPGVDEFIKENVNGLFIKPQHSEDIAEKILMLLNKREMIRSLGEQARVSYENSHTFDVMFEKILTIYVRQVRK